MARSSVPKNVNATVRHARSTRSGVHHPPTVSPVKQGEYEDSSIALEPERKMMEHGEWVHFALVVFEFQLTKFNTQG
jgi:hypothetical protein